ncbi:MAG: hypothetical protein EHM88_16325 [Candidatus Rokuibacteriota bacterium]|nr:MAG: hypothetical protein EHM88_16325 [Candidatus Rokubacteria bacterium]
MGGTAWEPTPWRTVQRPAWLVVGAGRRVRLEDVVSGTESIFPVRRLAPDGLVAWKQVVERGYEDYVAKDEASPYTGGPTRRWLKVKRGTGPSPRTAGVRRISSGL